MRDFLYRFRVVFLFQAIFIPSAFIMWGWMWGLLNIVMAFAGWVIGVKLAGGFEETNGYARTKRKSTCERHGK